jgi:hypothetical protein
MQAVFADAAGISNNARWNKLQLRANAYVQYSRTLLRSFETSMAGPAYGTNGRFQDAKK